MKLSSAWHIFETFGIVFSCLHEFLLALLVIQHCHSCLGLDLFQLAHLTVTGEFDPGNGVRVSVGHDVWICILSCQSFELYDTVFGQCNQMVLRLNFPFLIQDVILIFQGDLDVAAQLINFDEAIAVYVNLMEELTHLEVIVVHVAKLKNTDLNWSAEVRDPLNSVNRLAMIPIHDTHFALKLRATRFGPADEPDQHLDLPDVQQIVLVDVIGGEGRPVFHDSHEVDLADH